MPFIVPIDQAKSDFPEYKFIRALTPSAQKAAFHVKDANDRDLCLKIISPDYEMDRLSREIHALQLITHPNVVRLMEYTYSSTVGSLRHFIIEEFIDGNDLTVDLQTGQRWQINRASSFFGMLCDGLFEINKVNVVHRDLKPSNIRVRPDGSPVIIDFGMARHLDLTDLTNTSEGAAIGTPLYFSPEQFKGTKYEIDHRTDLFALGILLYQALVGKHPFFQTGMTYSQLKDAICDSHDYLNVQNFTTLPTKYQLIITRLLEKERSKRPRDASQIANILRKIGVTS